MIDFIIDSSVAAKWLFKELNSEKAAQLISRDIYLRAPDLIVAELANILWKKGVRGGLTAGKLSATLNIVLRDYIDVAVHLLPTRILMQRALQIALTTGQSAYDSLYLAAAMQARCRLITADERFVRSIKNSSLQPHIVSLNDPTLVL